MRAPAAPRPAAPAPSRRGAAARTASTQVRPRRVLQQVAGRPGLDRPQDVGVGVVTWSAPATRVPGCAPTIARSPRRRPCRASAGPSARRRGPAQRPRPAPRRRPRPRRPPRCRARAASSPTQPGAHDGVVVDDEHPDHGRAARPARAGRHLDRTRVPRPGALLDVQRARRRPAHPVAHAGQPEPLGGLAGSNPLPSSLHLDPRRRPPPSASRTAHDWRPRRAGARWPAPPGRRAAARPRVPGARAPMPSCDVHPHAHPGLARRTARRAGAGPRAACDPSSATGAKRGDQRARLGQVLPGACARCQPEPLRGPAAVARQPACGRLGQHDDAGEALGEGVVDLAGHPLALGHDALRRGAPRPARRRAACELLDQVGAAPALLDEA